MHLTNQINGHVHVPQDPVKPFRQNYIVHFWHLPTAMRVVRAYSPKRKLWAMQFPQKDLEMALTERESPRVPGHKVIHAILDMQ